MSEHLNKLLLRYSFFTLSLCAFSIQDLCKRSKKYPAVWITSKEEIHDFNKGKKEKSSRRVTLNVLTTTTSCTCLRDIIPAKRESIQDKSSLAKKCSIILNLAFLHQKCLKILIWCSELLDLNYIFASQYRN